MTDKADVRLPIGATLWDAAGAIWALKLPYVALVLLLTLPWTAVAALGLLDPLVELQALRAETDGSAALADYPLGLVLIGAIAGLVTLWIFGIFWLRYLMLGSQEALRVTPAAFAGMLGRFAIYGLVVGTVAFILLMLGVVLVCGVVIPLCSAFGLPALLVNTLAGAIGIFAVYGLPVGFIARTSLVFPAIVLGERMTLIESWSAMRGATWNLIAVIFLILVAIGSASYAIQYLTYGLLGVDYADPAQQTAVLSHWLVGYLLGPITSLCGAFCWAVVAIAHRDLASNLQTDALDASAEATG